MNLLPHLLAIAGFGLLCGLWVLVQRRGRAPSGGCSSCSCGGGRCEREGAEEDGRA